MEEGFTSWVTMMFYENCLEREADGIAPYKNVEDYAHTNYSWLREKYLKTRK